MLHLSIICIWTILEAMVLMVCGQSGNPPIAPFIPRLPPPPTVFPIIRHSIVFVGGPIITAEDTQVTIYCGHLIDEVAITTNVTNATVTWYKDGVMLTTGSAPNVEVISDDGRLCEITSTLLAVGGRFGTDVIYSCEICSTSTNCKRNSSSIAVCGEQHFMPPTSNPIVTPLSISLSCGQNVEVSTLTGVGSVVMQCAPFNRSAHLPMQVYKDDKLIPGGAIPYTIASPTDDDFGTYTFVLSTDKCDSPTAVSRILQVVNNSVTVFVGEPVITAEYTQVTIDCGQLIDEVVNTINVANPMVTWYKDGHVLTAGSVINVGISDDGRLCIIPDTLLAVGGQFGSDGNYSCEVCSTPTDCQRNDTFVTNCGKPHIMAPTRNATIAPFLILMTCGQDIEVPILTGDTTILIECIAFNGTDPLIAVYKDGVLIPGASFSYAIAGANREAFGTYTFVLSTEKCGSDIAVSRILRQESLIFDEDVSQPVSVENGVMRVRIGSTAYTVNGFIVQIICNVISTLIDYPATISWLRNEEHYETRGNVSMITVTDANHSDIFTCIADNTISSQRKETNIIFVRNHFCI